MESCYKMWDKVVKYLLSSYNELRNILTLFPKLGWCALNIVWTNSVELGKWFYKHTVSQLQRMRMLWPTGSWKSPVSCMLLAFCRT